MNSSPKYTFQIIAGIAGLVLGGIIVYGIYSFYIIQTENNAVLGDVMLKWNDTMIENERLEEVLSEKEATINSFQGQIQDIGKTVGTLEKLAQTDEELLKKYSKVYFLNENYVPASLSDIDEKYVYNGTTNYTIYAKVWPYLRNLLDAAVREDVDLLVASAYRSFETQGALKANYTIVYGTGANKFSADQGYSEHQLGTAVDFTTSKIGGAFPEFENQAAYTWLTKNAYKYGFILSYPKNNAYYKFEPWHWRFVGISLARALHEESKFFYDLDQREIDKYLINIFD